MFQLKKSIRLMTLLLIVKSAAALATGMVPESSLLIIEEQDKGGSINVTNTDPHPSLLYTNVVDIPDDKGTHLTVTQPVTRVEGGQTQQLRFILATDAPLTTEHLKRVTFEGIPPKTKSDHSRVSINIRQDIPVLIHPVSLPVVKDAWTLLKWSATGNTVTVKNDSPYVVRLAENLVAEPSGVRMKLKQTYILPGQTLSAQANTSLAGNSQLKFFPASRYGIDVPSYIATLNQ
ncbi:fimbria/pilus chaperone family protein [Lelliottia wanjuensis]|uniref:fimbria/pilus chaperone family protein n=1 Tax=Lelliottia wanjuensis TaxID=3050585 RepID=UPI00254C618A|nr:fimbria/pilus chaperone family protein [Lelliottia sp. V104_15]MDK9607143.1 fimbria/pilus chaperone family protein [Lelliottia sp. V104_15]